MRSSSWALALFVVAAAQPALPLAAQAPAPDATLGRIQVLLLSGRSLQPVAGAQVSTAAGAPATTDARGVAFVEAPAGSHSVQIHVPAGQLPLHRKGGAIDLRVDDVRAVPGYFTRLIVTTDENGKLVDTDLIVPEPVAPEVSAEAPPSEAVPDQPAVAAPTPGGPTGTVTGRVVSSTEAPVAGAKIYVLGVAAETETDQQGRFSIALPDGAYSLSIVHLDYTGQTLEGVVVKSGAVNELAIVLQPAPIEMDDYVVRARRIRGSVATVMEERRESASVTDAVGAEDIAKSPDSTASAATRRIVGATVVGGQFLFVRGLGGRYTTVRLNGVPMPSTDPDLPGFQLDLFPASLLSALNIVKTFTPDIPGDFAGGSMNIVTRDFPEKLTLTASLGLASNTETLGRTMLTYPGGDLDWLGLDDGTRSLPEEVPNRRLDDFGRAGQQPSVTTEELEEASRAFNPVWETEQRTALPNLSLGLSVGDTAEISEHRLGYLATLGYRYQLKRYQETRRRYGSEAEPVRDTLQRDVGKEEASLGGLGTLNYELADGHEVGVVSMLTQSGEDSTSFTSGVTENEGRYTERTQLRFVTRRLFFNQLLGQHDFDAVEANWQVNASTVDRDEPDTRNVFYVLNEATDELELGTGASSAERVFTELAMLDLGGGVDFTLPIDDSKLKAGYMGRSGDRDFSARFFNINVRGLDTTLPANELLSPDNVGDGLEYQEGTDNNDGYGGTESLHAGYAMVDAGLLAWLRVTGGARIESYKQKISSESPFAAAGEEAPPATDRSETDVLPAAGLVFALSDQMSVRAAYGGTVARPLTRELAPFELIDFVLRRTTTGNPSLKRTYVHNFDLRWEMFPEATEVLAASAFYKIFRDPIESVIIDDASNLNFQNIPEAENMGVELEARVGLDRIAEALERFSLTANFAWIHSRVTLSDEQSRMAYSRSRPMAGQSPYVANVSLGYSEGDTGLSLNLFYNVFGRRIQDVGRGNLPDVYEQPFHAVDATATYRISKELKVGASGTNLLRQPIVFKQGPVETTVRHEGIGFGLNVSYAN